MLLVEVTRKWKAIGWMTAVWMLCGVMVRAEAPQTTLPPQQQTGAPARVALLDDALPGHDRTANTRLAEALLSKGFEVTRLTADQLLAPETLSAQPFCVLILPHCASLPAETVNAVDRLAREGMHTICIGGPLVDRALWRVDGCWLDATGRAALVERVEPTYRPFEIKAGMDLKAWRRVRSGRDENSTFVLVPEGPEGTACLRLDIERLQGWEVRHSPEVSKLFGDGDDMITLLAKSDKPLAQLAVEIIERDGSRWIAVSELTNTWRRVGLPLAAFRYWRDSVTKEKRGGKGDRLHAAQAVRICFGMSASHTPAMVGGAHTVWLADVGSARDPLAAANLALPPADLSLESLYPRYKTHVVTGEVSVAGMSCRDVVCAIPRTRGEGYKRGAKWRFMTLAEAHRPDGMTGGACEWLLLNSHSNRAGSVFAGFGYCDPSVWSTPPVLARVVAAVENVTRGTLIETAGPEQFAYWPGEPVTFGASLRHFGASPREVTVTFSVERDGRAVWRTPVSRMLSRGATVIETTWQPPAESAEYRYRITLLDGKYEETVSQTFAVLDPAPDPHDAFITVRDGNFWLKGERWYPVGMNFWPLYVSGMDHADYWAGWLRDPFYAPEEVERDLIHLADLGVNMVSIQTPPQREYRNLLDFLRRCRRHDIYVNLFMGQASPLAFKEAELKGYLEAARLPGNATVFAYDTIWEPGNHVFKNDAARARWDGAWRDWIDERYGSLARAERDWGVKARRDADGRAISPPDAWFREDGAWRVQLAAYRRFMDTLTSRLWGKAHCRLRELDPNHLISFRQGNTLPYDFALSGPVKHIDFICPEGYAIPDTDEGEDAIGFITRYTAFTTGGKPVVWSEFGLNVWDDVRMTQSAAAIERQGRYSERFYRTGLAAGAVGTAPWWWVGGYRVGERSDYGVIGPDRVERPAARLIRTYAPRFKTAREPVTPTEWFVFDRDAHAGGYWRAAFHEGAAAYRAARQAGHMLGVRSPGSGLSQAEALGLAVGNVPCDGTNPPKYLDAEFTRMQIRDAEGVWREAENGAVVLVASDQSVRARIVVGNTQVATWRADDRQHAVTLRLRDKAGVRTLGRHGLPLGCDGRPADVPCLADADFGEIDLFQTEEVLANPLAFRCGTGILPVFHGRDAHATRGLARVSEGKTTPLPVELAVQMEVAHQPPIPFGEVRTFTLKAKDNE